MLAEGIIPNFDIFQRYFFGDVVHHDCAMSILHVIGYQAAKPFLSGSVPELHSILMSVSGHVFNVKVNADGWLNLITDTLSPS